MHTQDEITRWIGEKESSSPGKGRVFVGTITGEGGGLDRSTLCWKWGQWVVPDTVDFHRMLVVARGHGDPMWEELASLEQESLPRGAKASGPGLPTGVLLEEENCLTHPSMEITRRLEEVDPEAALLWIDIRSTKGAEEGRCLA